jgi:hypothetical protein
MALHDVPPNPVLPWPGWNVIHSDWSQIQLFTAAELRTSPELLYQAEISRMDVCDL